MPGVKEIEQFLQSFETKYRLSFKTDLGKLSSTLKGYNYGDIENFALSVMRRYILSLPERDIQRYVKEELRDFSITATCK